MVIPKEKNKFKAIIIGATSGIGRELAKLLSNSGYLIGATGRRKYLLSTPTEAEVVLHRNVLRIMYCERHPQYQQKENQQEIEELFH